MDAGKKTEIKTCSTNFMTVHMSNNTQLIEFLKRKNNKTNKEEYFHRIIKL